MLLSLTRCLLRRTHYVNPRDNDRRRGRRLVARTPFTLLPLPFSASCKITYPLHHQRHRRRTAPHPLPPTSPLLSRSLQDVLAATLATQTCACAKFSEGLKFGHEEVCYSGMRPPEVLAAESGAVAAAASVSAAGATIGVVPVGAGAGSGTAGGSSSGDVMMVEAGAVSVATSMHEQAHRHHQQQCSSAAHDNSDMMESERHARGGTAASTAGSSSGVEGSSYSISSGRHMRGGDAGSNSSSGGGGGRCNWNVEVDSCSGRTGRRQGGQLDSASSSSNRQGRSAAMEFDLPSAER